ncbi:hypothetical protein GCM10028803_26320 [Larkinella knui]|uniref:DUF3352 domain-containing protein n=1 Tax=Larkinella knui TaxID=2025310 RepID=A0A3P1CWA0_9BACT|nr:hypothetical protein [Larkinella knui]RRB17682.1 hypothetical protein EHT87_05210 [Larkinella knui]
MTKKQLWIGIGILTLILGGYFAYRWWKAPARSTWMLIPSDALLVLESSTLQDTLSKQAQLNEMALQTTPIFQEAARSIEKFVWSPLDTASALQFLRDKPVWYSLHPTSKDRLGFIFYIPIGSLQDQPFVNRILNPDADRFRVLSHPYEDTKIHELLTVRNESLGSFIVLDDYLVGSPSTILMESVVRRMKQPFTETPLQRADVSLIRPGNLAGIYVRSSVLSAILSPHEASTDYQSKYIKALLPTELLTRFRQSPSRSHLIGLSTDDIGAKTALANLFDRQTPFRINCGNLIPDQTTTFFHFSLSDGPRFGKALTAFINSEDEPDTREGRRKLRPLLQNEENGIYKYVGTEIALLRLDAPSADRRLVMLIHSPNVDRLWDRYQLAALLASGTDHVSNTKPFLQYRISSIEAPDLPAFLFGGLFRGFEQNWLAQVGDYLVIANGQGVLQEYLQSVDQRTVWSESYRQRDLLTQTLRPANFTAYTRFTRAGESVTANWPQSWQQLLNHDETALDNVENLVYQSTYGRERIYSSLILGHTTRRASEAVLNRVFLQRKLPLNAPLLSQPMVIGDFVGSSGVIWAVDNAQQFILITPEGEKHTLGTVNGPVVSPLVPVDFLNNGRLQYVFATPRSLYIADPVNGLAKLQSFPLPEGLEPATLMAPRRDQNRTLILLMAHHNGSVYGFDRQQKRFVRSFAVTGTEGAGVSAFHAPVRNQSLAVISVQKEGKLYYWNENGGSVPGFPVDLKAEVTGPAWLETGNPATITTLTRQGELTSISSEGQILERNQLFRPIRRGSFQLLPEVNQNGYLLLRTSDTEAAILDRKGHSLFEVRGLRPGQTTIRYHVLGSGVSLISVKSGNFTTLYDLAGHPVGDRPIPGNFPVELQFSPTRNKLFVYSTDNKAVQIWSVKLR